MYGLTFASYNLILGGLFTWVCDFYTLVAVVDQMLQSIHNGASGVDENSGYVAYGKLRAGGCSGLRDPKRRRQQRRRFAGHRR